MALVNEHFMKLSDNYLFADVAKKVNAYRVSHPNAHVISLGIGDVTQPLCPAVIEAMHRAVDDLAVKQSFHGYGPEHGYDFLREAILKNDFAPRGIHLDPSEIFINDGAKSDTGNIQEIVRWDNSVAVTDPVYPVYIDSNAMIGRAGTFANGRWSNVTYLPCTAENDFVPALPDHRVDMIYLCYPNNPTGTVLSKAELKKWVNYALANDAIIFYDAAYEAYIQDKSIPHSIYEIRGARKCAIEFHSYSKTAGFTGVRCGYTVIPRDLKAVTTDGRQQVELNHLWERRQCAGAEAHAGGTDHPRRQGTDPSYHRLLYGQRPTHDRRPARHGLQRLWRRECSLSLGAHSRGSGELALLRADALWRLGGLYPRRGLRPQRRGLLPAYRLWRPRQLRRSHAATAPMERMTAERMKIAKKVTNSKGIGKIFSNFAHRNGEALHVGTRRSHRRQR